LTPSRVEDDPSLVTENFGLGIGFMNMQTNQYAITSRKMYFGRWFPVRHTSAFLTGHTL